jgi:hypothetical protein
LVLVALLERSLLAILGGVAVVVVVVFLWDMCLLLLFQAL